MMVKLAQLNIVDTPNPCSTTLWIENLFIGATVVLSANNQVLSSTVATWASQPFSFTPPQSKGTQISAVQKYTGYQDSDPAFVKVDPFPSQQAVNNGAFILPIYECAQCVALHGLVPDATVTVFPNAQLSNALGTGSVN